MTIALRWGRRLALAYALGLLAGAAEFYRESRTWAMTAAPASPTPGPEHGTGDEPWPNLAEIIGAAMRLGGDPEEYAEAIIAAGWTRPAATPGRDELHQQMAAALHDVRLATRYYSGPLTPSEVRDVVAAVTVPVDDWVAAHTAENWTEPTVSADAYWETCEERDASRAGAPTDGA